MCAGIFGRCGASEARPKEKHLRPCGGIVAASWSVLRDAMLRIAPQIRWGWIAAVALTE
jgi:hypothetical protein